MRTIYLFRYMYSACSMSIVYVLKGKVFERGLLRIALFIYSRSPYKSCPKAALFRPGIKPVKAKVKGCRFRRYGNECCSNEPCLPYAFDLCNTVYFRLVLRRFSIVPSKLLSGREFIAQSLTGIKKYCKILRIIAP